MAEPLKLFVSPELVRRLAADVQCAHASFPASAFVRQSCAGLDDLELLDRGKHIARALDVSMRAQYELTKRAAPSRKKSTR